MSNDKEQAVIALRSRLRDLKGAYRDVRRNYILLGLFFVVLIPLGISMLPLGVIRDLAGANPRDLDNFTDRVGAFVVIGAIITFIIGSHHLKKIDSKIESLHLQVSELVLSFSNPEFKFQPQSHELHKLAEYEAELEQLEALDKRNKNKVFRAAGCLQTFFGIGSILLFVVLWGLMQDPATGYGAILIFPVMIISGFFAFFYILSLISRFKKHGIEYESRLDELRDKVSLLKAYKGEKVSETNQILKQSAINHEDLSWCQSRQSYYKRNLFVTAGIMWAGLSYLVFGGAVWSFITLQSHISSVDIFSLILLWIIYGHVKTYFNLAYQADIKKRLFPKVCEIIGMEYSNEPVFEAKEIEPHSILPTHKFFYVDDAFRGVHKGRRLEFQEFISCKNAIPSLDKNHRKGPVGRIKMSAIGPKAFLWKVENKNGYARGVAARIPLNKNLYFQTIAATQKNKNISSTAPLTEVTLLSPELAHRYKILSSDQVEAREIFDPAFMERFVLLADHLGGDIFTASFYQNELVIVVLSDIDYFDVGDLDTSLSFDCFEPLLRHVQAYKDIIDLLDLSSDRGF